MRVFLFILFFVRITLIKDKWKWSQLLNHIPSHLEENIQKQYLTKIVKISIE